MRAIGIQQRRIELDRTQCLHPLPPRPAAVEWKKAGKGDDEPDPLGDHVYVRPLHSNQRADRPPYPQHPNKKQHRSRTELQPEGLAVQLDEVIDV